MQLSLIDDLGVEKRYFVDIFAESYFDSRRNRIRLKTIEGQLVPKGIKIACPSKILKQFPEGTIYKLDTRLVRQIHSNPYFVAVNRKFIQRALEFFELNLKIQHGFDDKPKVKKVEKIRVKSSKIEVIDIF